VPKQPDVVSYLADQAHEMRGALNARRRILVRCLRPSKRGNQARHRDKIPQTFTLLFVSGVLFTTPAWSEPLSVSDFGQLALRCAPTVAPSTLASIAQTESAFQPYAINDNTTGASGAPATRDSAVQIASKLLKAGHSIDVGIMQINSSNFAQFGLTLEAAFDSCQSVAAAAAILTNNYAGGETHDGQQAALRVALSKYNTGNAQRGFANGYVHKVELAARHVVPALDVGIAEAAIDRQPPSPAAPSSVPAAPNTPPAWDVWSSFDYAASHHPDSPLTMPSSRASHAAVLANAETGPTAKVTASGPSVER
jgi:type IV secretion system protein VirB1